MSALSILPSRRTGTAWMAAGACVNEMPDLFSPGPGESGYEGRAVCARCHVRLECLFHALHRTDLDGIWGGTSQTERDALRRWDRQAATTRQREAVA